MWLLFVPILLLVVAGCHAWAALFAGLFWLLGAAWPWLLIALGAWLFWHEDGRHDRRRQAHGRRAIARSAPTPPAAAGTPPKDSARTDARPLRPALSCRSTCRSRSSRSAARSTCCSATRIASRRSRRTCIWCARPPATTCRARSTRILSLPADSAGHADSRDPAAERRNQELKGAARPAGLEAGRHRPGPAAPGHRPAAGQSALPGRALRRARRGRGTRHGLDAMPSKEEPAPVLNHLRRTVPARENSIRSAAWFPRAADWRPGPGAARWSTRASTRSSPCPACSSTGPSTGCTRCATPSASSTPPRAGDRVHGRRLRAHDRPAGRVPDGAGPGPAQRQRGAGHRLRLLVAGRVPAPARSIRAPSTAASACSTKCSTRTRSCASVTKWSGRALEPSHDP